MADAVADPVALLIVPCPDCGRNVVTYVARHCQNGVERFYKCRSHIPARGGCDFYRCPQAYTESLAAAATPLAQIMLGQEQAAQALGVEVPGQQNGPPEGTQSTSSASAVAGYMVAASVCT